MNNQAPGFTLLELLVVLVLLGAVVGVALPNLSQLYNSVSARIERDTILDQLGSLGAQAHSQQRTLVVFDSREPLETQFEQYPSLANYPQFDLQLPTNWQLHLEQPLIARANGVCLGGELRLIREGVEQMHLNLKPPYCRVGQ